MEITAENVRELREKTGAGMMDCKKALTAVEGDLELAIEHLRKQGGNAVAKKASRVATEGLVATAYSSDRKYASLVEINCETDFVSKNDDFVKFLHQVALLVVDQKPGSVEECLTLPMNGSTVEGMLTQLVAKIGEKISLRRFRVEEASGEERLGGYIHLGSKIGVLIKLSGKKIEDEVLKDMAMHVAASHPLFLNQSDIPGEIIKKEKEIFAEQLKSSSKSPEMMEKILLGKMAKYASEVCLNDQIFIKDPQGKNSVSQILKKSDPSLHVVSFVRFQVGEGLEKKQHDFAQEVAQMAK